MGFAAPIPDGKSFFESDSAGAFRTFKLDHYLKTTLHNPDLRSAEDKDIILKMEEVSRLYFVPDVLYRVRELPQSCSRGPHQVVESRFTFGRVRVDACKRRSQRQASQSQPQELFVRNLNELARRDAKIQLYLSLVSLFMDDMLKRLDLPAALKNDSREKVLTWIAVEGNIGRICEVLRERLRDGRHEAMVEEIAARFVPTTKKASLSAGRTPLVSIILPAYNAARHIQDAIEGVLAQTYQNIEFIVINDGSTDATEPIVKRYANNRIRLYSQPNAGVSAARNNGIRRAAGDFIITVDHDDIITPDYVERHMAMFEKHPEADLVYCDEYLVDAAGNPIRILEKPDYRDKRRLISDLFHRGFPVIPFRGACIRKSVFDKIGLFDESLAIAEDYEIWLRFIRHGLVGKHLKGALYRRRMVENSLSRSHTLQKAQMHFSVVNTFAETFEYTQLFPETDWRKIDPGQRDFYARFLTAKVFVSLGQEYRATDASGFFTETAFAYAADYLEKCLELSPDDPAVLALLHKCRQLGRRVSRAARPGVAAALS
jgi:glycosyltransferase involved in cell wall biosynthesis